ncbi:MAG: energy-coupling factor transporter transmembrane component T family protein [Candidatus Limnocylindrales bacterium]
METASGYYRPGPTWLHRRHPITKLLALAWLILSAFLLPPPGSVALIVVVLIAAAVCGLVRPLSRASRVGLVLLGSILIVNGFFYPGAHDVLLRLGPLTLTREGLEAGTAFALRVLLALEASLLFLFTTLADDFLEALVERGVSPRLGWVMLAAMQLVPRLQARAEAILAAQQARGLEVGGSIGRRVGAIVPLVGPLVLGALIDVRERTFALEARGFGSGLPRTAYRVVADPPGERLLRWLIAAAIAGLLIYGLAHAAGAI